MKPLFIFLLLLKWTNLLSQTLVSISVTPLNPSTINIGSTLQFTATGTFSDNTMQDLTNQVIWSVSDLTVASISNAAGAQGVCTGVSVGSTTISATLGAVGGTRNLEIIKSLVSISVTPLNPASIDIGSTLQFTATGTFSDNTTQDLTNQVIWTVSDLTVASISNAAGAQGVCTGVSVGSTTISATLGAVGGTRNLEIINSLVSISVTPLNPAVINVGSTLQFTATGTFSDNTTQDLTNQVIWTVSDLTVASISNAAGAQGVCTGVSVGSTTISATLGAVGGTRNLEIINSLVSISVTPLNPASIDIGSTLQFIATGTFSDNTMQDLTNQVIWSVSDLTVASISNAAGAQGLCTGISVGSTTITATLGAIAGTSNAVITDNSNVGIGIQNPTTKLDVNGGIRTKFSGTYLSSNLTDSILTTVAIPIPSLPSNWDFKNTVIIVTNAEGALGYVLQANLSSQTNINVKYYPVTSGIVRLNWIIFKL